MFTRAIAILLLLCSVAVSLSGFFVYAGFEINKGYIAKELCVNKDKPQLQCNGKCYLMKKLKQAQDKEQKQERQSQKIQLQEAIVTLPFTFKRFPITAEHLRIPLKSGMPVSQMNAIFHPPQINC